MAALNCGKKLIALPSNHILRSEIQFTDTKTLRFEGAAVAWRHHSRFRLRTKIFSVTEQQRFAKRISIYRYKNFALRGGGGKNGVSFMLVTDGKF
ncbi:MAG: hypothetical protein IJ262_02180 [Clostridia bacterium]|nr:hypothetical protein [Clostridia bacterium]